MESTLTYSERRVECRECHNTYTEVRPALDAVPCCGACGSRHIRVDLMRRDVDPPRTHYAGPFDNA